MNKKDIKNKLKLINFSQSKHYLDRTIQIKPFDNYDNYLDKYVCERLSFSKYIKTKLKSKLIKDTQIDISSVLDDLYLDNAVCVIAPFYKGKPLDGYFKRVEQIDEQVLNKFNLIYLDYTDLADRKFSITKYDDNHTIIKFNSFNEKHLEYIKEIINKVKKIYIHSIHILMPDIVNYEMFDVVFNKGNKTVLDLHGVVPEELKEFDSTERAELAEIIEEMSINLSDKVVTMSKAMSDYYIDKYNINDKFIPVSILPFNDNRIFNKGKNNEILNVVYSGGLQKWQNIDLIKESVRKNIDKFNFKIFTHDSDRLKSAWSDMNSNNLIIDSKTNEEIYREYESCDFGYILRDDNVINNASCPTKSIEYISYGIIPILKSDKIGDYKEFGLKYISIDDFDNGIIPNEAERKKMIENNHQVYMKVVEQSLNGQKDITKFLDN